MHSRIFYKICFCMCLLLACVDNQMRATLKPELNIDWQILISEPATGMTLSPHGDYVAFGDVIGHKLSFLNIQTRTLEKSIDIPTNSKDGIGFTPAWSPNGLYIAVTFQNNVHLIDREYGSIIWSYSGNMITAESVQWMEDSLSLAVLDNIGIIYIIDVLTGKAINTIDVGIQGEGISYSTFDWSFSNLLFAVPLYWSNTIGFLDKEGRLSKSYAYQDQNNNTKTNCVSPIDSINQISHIAWSPNGKLISVSGKYGINICLFGNNSSIKTQSIDNESTSTVAWSLNNHWLATTNAYDPTCWIKVFDATEDFTMVLNSQGDLCGIYALAWSPDENYIFAGGTNKLWIGEVK